MEQSSMQQEKTIIGLEKTCQEKKYQPFVTNIELEKQTRALNVQIQYWKGKLEMTKVQLSKPIQVPPTKMHNRVQMTFYKPMCLLRIQDYYPFWGHFAKNTCFHKKEF